MRNEFNIGPGFWAHIRGIYFITLTGVDDFKAFQPFFIFDLATLTPISSTKQRGLHQTFKTLNLFSTSPLEF